MSRLREAHAERIVELDETEEWASAVVDLANLIYKLTGLFNSVMPSEVHLSADPGVSVTLGTETGGQRVIHINGAATRLPMTGMPEPLPGLRHDIA